MSLENYKKISSSLKKNIKLVAVSKGQSVKKILKIYELGHRDFGENYLQELITKKQQLPNDIIWHFMGNIQTNKLKDICINSNYIHSVSREKVLKKLSSIEIKEMPKILLQLKLGNETSKSGFLPEEIYQITKNKTLTKQLKIVGLMGISQNTNDRSKIRMQFSQISELFNELSKEHQAFEFLSLGMSQDYNIAIDCGSNMIRLGSIIFGERK
tara:strand:- start:1713 stop:2351 length:639 start_codon:yes stop_codon:yes gene_type:complete